jgi:hypothetical protein
MICDRCARGPGGTLQGRLDGQDVDNPGLGAAVDRRRRGPDSGVCSSSRGRAAPSSAGDGVRAGAGGGAPRLAEQLPARGPRIRVAPEARGDT